MARQPIFDRRMKLYGYELLFRKSTNNFFESYDEVQATIDVINHSFLVFNFDTVTDGTLGFLNIPGNLLVSDYLYALPSDQVVIEILERIEVTPEVIQACKKLKAKGFRLALDDFVLEGGGKKFLPLMEFVDIVKVEFPKIKTETIRTMIQKYEGDIIFLAEKVETMTQYKHARDLGFALFQGYFFAKPSMIRGSDIGYLNANLLLIIKEIEGKQNIEVMEEIVSRDVGLSYKLLRMANLVQFGARQRISSIKQAIVYLGLLEMKRWAYLMLLRGFQREENEVLINSCVVRGKMLSQMAKTVPGAIEFHYFLTGIFSSVDVLMNDTMPNALAGLMLNEEVNEALLGTPNKLRMYLEIVLSYERGLWNTCQYYLTQCDLRMSECTEYYLEAIAWQKNMG